MRKIFVYKYIAGYRDRKDFQVRLSKEFAIAVNLITYIPAQNLTITEGTGSAGDSSVFVFSVGVAVFKS